MLFRGGDGGDGVAMVLGYRHPLKWLDLLVNRVKGWRWWR